jgi:hypothetical protein
MYHPKIVERIKRLPANRLGVRMARWAIYHDIPVNKLALAVGATRQSVYNWMNGGEIFVAYRPAVERLVSIMQQAKTADDAWRAICQAFDLRT